MESTLTAKTELTIVLLSLFRSVVLGFYGYYIGEVVLPLSRSGDYLTRPAQVRDLSVI